MSIRYMTMVWDMDLPVTDKFVLLALADCANDEGECWPSIATLMRKTNASERTVQRALKGFEDAGHLTRRQVPGKGCRYFLHPRHTDTPVTATPVSERREPPSHRHPTPVTVTPKPSKNHQEPSSSDTSYPQSARKKSKPKTEIPDWLPAEPWAGYLEMRKAIGKPPTERAIAILIRKLDGWRRAGHDPGEILDTSTERNWAGLFEPKEQRNDRQRQPQSHSERRSVREIGEDLARELIGAAGAGDSSAHLLLGPCETRRDDRW